MLYIKKVIDMLRSVLHDFSIKICTGCDHSDERLSPDALDLFTSISRSLDRIEYDFSKFIEIYQEFNKNEKIDR